MNTDASVKRILCFGDSNTWGRKPGDDNLARFSSNVRWTGVLQNLLGRNFEIIEEGLNGRTTNRESPHMVGKNGCQYLLPCIQSQNPIDLVILSLGKNDLKSKYQSTPDEIRDGIKQCIEIIQKIGISANGKPPSILLLSVAIIIEKSRLRFGKYEVDFLGAHEKSKKLPGLFAELAKESAIEFLDISQEIYVSEVDGVHLDADMHRKFADILSEKIRSIAL